jgi:type IV pilus assembly protein PilY1
MLVTDQTQPALKPWQRRLAWTLIAALANPATVLPLSLYSSAVAARDTDIYLSTTYAGSTAEPAIMLILDTSDSMNATEGWREYPGAYDSHVEYLWNDIGIIRDTEQTTAHADRITTAAAPVLTKYGSWAGETLAQRQALWNAAKAYANATESGDPGARNTYRNYNNANWIFWLPAGTDEGDKRLWSNAFNRWAGGVLQSSFPAQVRGGVDYGSTSDWRSYNKCNDSLEKLLPSTVFAPTPYPRNTGKYLNQQWQRWERHLDLIKGRVADGDTTYPTTLGATQVPSATATLPILAGSVVGAIGSNIRARSEFMGTAGAVAPYPVRDSYPRFSGATPPTLITSFGSVTDIGDQGQPIRTATGASRSGWTDLKADMAGFNFQSYVNGLNSTQLVNVLGLYDIVADTTTAKHKAWKGNRDDATPPAFGKMTGTPAYYDFPGSLLKVPSGVAVTTTLCTRTCEIDADPGVAGKDAVFKAHDSGDPPKDGGNNTKYWVKSGATCVSTSVTGSDCSTAPAACAAIPGLSNSYTTINNTACKWSGRSSIYVEGVGTYHYGGTCSGACRGQGFGLGASDCPSGASSADYCSETLPDLTIGSTVYPSAALSSGDGSTNGCTDKADTTATCAAREGSVGCRYVGSTNTCVNQTTSSTTSVAGTDDYTVYPFAAKTDYLEHDCKADNGTAGNPSNGFLTTASNRTFGQAWNSTNSAAGTVASYTPTDPAASYPVVDMYSVNYLNWKFGPKGPTGAPIGRKTRLQIAKDALTDLVATTDGVRFGLTVYNRMPTDVGVKLTEGSQGGNVAYAIRRMGVSSIDSDYGNRVTLSAAINGVVGTGTTPLTEVMYEAYLYFRGETPLFGTNTTAAVGGGQVSAGKDASAIGADGKYVSPMMSNPNSTTPATCQKNYVVLVSDGGPENDNQADTLVRALSQDPPFIAATVSTQQATPTQQFEDAGVPYGPTDIVYSTNYIWLDELTHFMANGDMSPGGASATDALAGVQTVNTYTIGFAGGNSPVLISAAARGRGANYLAEDSSGLAKALKDAIIAIRDWNPTVAVPLVPVSPIDPSVSSDDVYLAFFGPVLQKCWDGTVKKFKLSNDATECGTDLDGATIPLCLTGQTDFGSGLKNVVEYFIDPTTLARTARVRDNAVSYWSDPLNPDGGKPNKGGTGHVLKTAAGSTPALRNVYTHLSSSGETDLTADVNKLLETNATLTKTLLGDASMTDEVRATLLNYARGGDPANAGCSDADSGTACSAWRAWPHGDVLHSNPAILPYEKDVDGVAATADPLLYMFYMSNDGLLHAVETATGVEKWAFMPEENIGRLAAMRENAVGEHLIAGDGSPKIYAKDVDGDGRIAAGDKAYVVFGMRRGGRVLYALDISDRDRPSFMWKVDNTTTGFEELGETWSVPDFARMRASADPVVVFGAGYDPVANDQLTMTLIRSGTTATVTTPIDHGYATGEEVSVSGAREAPYNGTKTITVTGARSFTFTVAGSPASPATGNLRVESNRAASMGRGVFFVNARTGALLRSFTPAASAGDNTQVSGMDFSIPSDATPVNVDLDSGGYVDRLYLGDLGGNVWRFDIDSASPTAWTAVKFADLTNGAIPRRKIFFPPAAVKQEFLGQRFDAIYVGTGDRENPLRSDNVDMMVMIKDFETGLTSSRTSPVVFSAGTGATNFYDLTANLVQFGSAAEKETARQAIKDTAGWFVRLETGGVAGEKVVNAPSVFFNVLRFATYSPLASASACVPPGKGTNYSMSALDGRIVTDTNHDGVVTTSDSRSSPDVSKGFASDDTLVFNKTPGGGGGGGGDDTTIFHMVCSDGPCRLEAIGRVGAGQRVYWFQEPEG